MISGTSLIRQRLQQTVSETKSSAKHSRLNLSVLQLLETDFRVLLRWYLFTTLQYWTFQEAWRRIIYPTLTSYPRRSPKYLENSSRGSMTLCGFLTSEKQFQTLCDQERKSSKNVSQIHNEINWIKIYIILIFSVSTLSSILVHFFQGDIVPIHKCSSGLPLSFCKRHSLCAIWFSNFTISSFHRTQLN